MTFQMDTSSDESYEEVGAGYKKLPPGRFHVEVVEVDETFQKQPQKVLVTFEVLNGTAPDQKGRRHTEYFSISPNAMDRLKRLAMVCKLIGPGEQKEVSFNDALGADLIIEVVPHSYEDKNKKMVDTTQMDFGGMWAVDHEDVKQVPRGKVGDRPAEEDTGSSDGGGDKWSDV